jgi:chromate reductase, NAD(P)H dehydrogenase (quinone)
MQRFTFEPTSAKSFPHIGAAIMSDQKTTLKVVGFSGSLRRGSLNSAALRALTALVPADLAIDIFDLSPIPLYNDDLRTKEGYPEGVQSFRDALKAADGVLIATPEYNYSIPGVLKNAIDWASRPPEQPFDGKPIAILGASPGALGSARAQYHLRQCFIYLNGQVMNRPEVMIGAANSKFDADGNLTDQGTADFLKKFLAAFADHIRYHQRARSVS